MRIASVRATAVRNQQVFNNPQAAKITWAQNGFLKGLWLRVRYAEGDRGSPVANRREVRVIVNYNLEALR